ncbi:hypothetical protein E1193_12535 [Micromonospora sp. KC606]|uniref:hypothetical protein n=1 Tax=Micromonospora sp. KC606 TaxID=2530379 RepID=UPI0010469385|nr:hypothetical protein [Micromonospora sp. KC606]TDC82179.1 hypothetical protein E1193_12535 [Micromonospora sp. KC606]
MFRAVFDDWQARADVWSALPDAPVVPDNPRRRSAWRWLRTRTGVEGSSIFGRPRVTPST